VTWARRRVTEKTLVRVTQLGCRKFSNEKFSPLSRLCRHGIEIGRDAIWLRLTPEQWAKLKTPLVRH
jgi:hypothetical protein